MVDTSTKITTENIEQIFSEIIKPLLGKRVYWEEKTENPHESEHMHNLKKMIFYDEYMTLSKQSYTDDEEISFIMEQVENPDSIEKPVSGFLAKVHDEIQKINETMYIITCNRRSGISYKILLIQEV